MKFTIRSNNRPDLAIEDGRIVPGPSPHATLLDLADHLIFPGLINSHDHLHLNSVPPLPHTAPFSSSYAWIAAFAPHFANPAVVRALAVPEPLRHWHGALKNLLCGVTTVAHHDPWDAVFEHPDFPVCVPQLGWAHSLGLGFGRAGLPRYGPEIVPSYRQAQGRPWVIHLAEGTDAAANAELPELDALGCLAENTVLVHGVGLTEADVARVTQAGASVVWCPASNLGMLGQTLEPHALAQAGRLMLATDSRLTGSFDLLDELRRAAQSGLSPAALVALVTTAPARLLRLPDCGALDVGCRADLLILRDTGADPAATLLQATRAQLRAVVRGGVLAIADPDFAPWFAACGIATEEITLDGVPKLIAAGLLGPAGVAALEPGLALGDG